LYNRLAKGRESAISRALDGSTNPVLKLMPFSLCQNISF
jgi:hypothetical protein